MEPAALAAALRGPEAERPVVLDVRNPDEAAVAAIRGSVLVPLHELPARIAEVRALAAEPGRALVVVCHHGVRSWHAAAFLASAGVPATSLAGGIDRWATDVEPTMRRY